MTARSGPQHTNSNKIQKQLQILPAAVEHCNLPHISKSALQATSHTSKLGLNASSFGQALGTLR